ncbi:MAG: WD40 repeat domain-containing protein [Labrys sp. (in: a-proteobacteria)]
MTSATMTSLTERVTAIDAGDHVIACAWLGRAPVFACAEGTVLVAGIGEEARVRPHGEAGILVAASDGRRLVTGGDDGRVMACDGDGRVQDIGRSGGAWIDAVAMAPGGAIAWSAGRDVTARDDKGGEKRWRAPSSVQGLGFAPKGYRVAVSHYNGVSFWFPNATAEPEVFEWKGSHLDVTVSPDGRFIVTSMQENTLHGWRVTDKQHMRMSGYPSKTRSFSWSPGGDWLATSGADAAIVWPFQDKAGPMGKAPRECGVRPAKVAQVAFHPKALVLAIGYDDGCILLCRLTDAAEILVRRAEKGSAITALAWDAVGAQLAFGAADGAAGILTLPAG